MFDFPSNKINPTFYMNFKTALLQLSQKYPHSIEPLFLSLLQNFPKKVPDHIEKELMVCLYLQLHFELFEKLEDVHSLRIYKFLEFYYLETVRKLNP